MLLLAVEYMLDINYTLIMLLLFTIIISSFITFIIFGVSFNYSYEDSLPLYLLCLIWFLVSPMAYVVIKKLRFSILYVLQIHAPLILFLLFFLTVNLTYKYFIYTIFPYIIVIIVQAILIVIWNKMLYQRYIKNEV